MADFEIRDPVQARIYVLQGLWLPRAFAPHPKWVKASLSWAFETLSEGYPVPPLGLIADIGYAALTPHGGLNQRLREIPGFDSSLALQYEDYVLGKLSLDKSFATAQEALYQYKDRDLVRCIAYLINAIRQQCGIDGAVISPPVVKAMLSDHQRRNDQLLAEAWESIEIDGLLPAIVDSYRQLTLAVRNTGALLTSGDVFDLMHGGALVEYSQRLAQRQVLRAAESLKEDLPVHRVRPAVHRQQVATQMLDEDTYPIGGFTSISNRGSIESLLHSQLAFIEPDESDRPDLFDVKFLRDELLYYSRDENKFFRRRQSFIFVLHPDLHRARFKDATLPFQRVVVLVGMLVAMVDRLTAWLSDEALSFEFIILNDMPAEQLEHEAELLSSLLVDQINHGLVSVTHAAEATITPLVEERARRSLCHCILISAGSGILCDTSLAEVSQVVVDGPAPKLALPVEQEPATRDGDADIDRWRAVTLELLRHCI